MFSKVISCFAFFAIAILSSNAYALNACPNVQVGANDTNPAIYSDCTMDTGLAVEYWLIMQVTSGFISVNGYSNASTAYVPPPVGLEEFGTWDSSTLYVSDMGSSYIGDCSEVTGSAGSAPVVSGNVYCGIIGNTDGYKVFLRGTWTGATFTDYQILTDAPGVGTPLAALTPVPAIPVPGLIVLGSLLGLIGMRRLKA